MDFFHHQDTARQRTGLLVMLFTLAVLAITGLVSVMSIGIYFYFTGEPFHHSIHHQLLFVELCGRAIGCQHQLIHSS